MKRVAEAAYCALRSVYLQCQWVLNKDMVAAKEEFDNTKRMITLAAEDPSIGYEASNHYFYNENTLLEKLLSLDKIINDVK